jgi:hypothetical protein
LHEHGLNDVTQTEIHTAEPLVSEPSAHEFEMAIKKLKRRKSPGTDQISAQLIKAGCRTIRSEIHKLVNYIRRKEELPNELKEFIIVCLFVFLALQPTVVVFSQPSSGL